MMLTAKKPDDDPCDLRHRRSLLLKRQKDRFSQLRAVFASRRCCDDATYYSHIIYVEIMHASLAGFDKPCPAA